MKYILAICDSHSTLSTALALVEGRSTAQVIYQMTAQEITQIKTLDDLSVYDLIIIGAIDWRIPATGFSLARHFRSRFNGQIIAVSNQFIWRDLMTKAGCTQALADTHETAEIIRDLLFPP